jgi:hypothetical protein
MQRLVKPCEHGSERNGRGRRRLRNGTGLEIDVRGAELWRCDAALRHGDGDVDDETLATLQLHSCARSSSSFVHGASRTGPARVGGRHGKRPGPGPGPDPVSAREAHYSFVLKKSSARSPPVLFGLFVRSREGSSVFSSRLPVFSSRSPMSSLSAINLPFSVLVFSFLFSFFDINENFSSDAT